MITINTYPNVRTAADMIPVSDWLHQNTTAKWEWRVSEEWCHPMLLDFENEKDATLFVLKWS